MDNSLHPRKIDRQLYTMTSRMLEALINGRTINAAHGLYSLEKFQELFTQKFNKHLTMIKHLEPWPIVTIVQADSGPDRIPKHRLGDYYRVATLSISADYPSNKAAAVLLKK